VVCGVCVCVVWCVCCVVCVSVCVCGVCGVCVCVCISFANFLFRGRYTEIMLLFSRLVVHFSM